MFSVPEMLTTEFAEPFAFTKSCRLMKIRSGRWVDKDTHTRIGHVDAAHIHERGKRFSFAGSTDQHAGFPLVPTATA